MSKAIHQTEKMRQRRKAEPPIRIKPDLSILFPHFSLTRLSSIIECMWLWKDKVCPTCQILLKLHIPFEKEANFPILESHPKFRIYFFLTTFVAFLPNKHPLKHIRNNTKKWLVKFSLLIILTLAAFMPSNPPKLLQKKTQMSFIFHLCKEILIQCIPTQMLKCSSLL